MNYNQSLCVETEFKHLTDLIEKFWVNSEVLNEQIKTAFNMGLARGRFWIDDMTAYNLHEQLKGEGGNLSNLRSHVTFNGEDAYRHDALYLFGSWLEDSIRNTHNHYFCNFKWSDERSLLLFKVTPSLELAIHKSIKPCELGKEEQREIIDNYKGYNGQPLRSYSTPEHLSPMVIEEYKIYGDSYIGQLLSQCFFHGIMCSQRKNTIELTNTLLSIYTEDEQAFNADNSKEIIDIASQCDFLRFILEISKPTFSSTEAAIKDIEMIQAEKLRKSQLTPEQAKAEEDRIRKQMSDMTKDIFASLDDDIEKEKQENIVLFGNAEKALCYKTPTTLVS